jgi:general secretion pathway protein F
MNYRLKNYQVVYALKQPIDIYAKPLKGVQGMYRHESIITAYSEKEIIRDFLERDAFILEVKPIHNIFPKWNKTSRSIKLQILQSISFNTRAGLTPTQAFEQVINTVRGKDRLSLNYALRSIKQGRSFVDSIEMLDWYDEGTVAILRTGENTGQLMQSINSAVTHYSKNSNLIKLMFGAVIWTTLDIFMAIQAVIGTRFGLIPNIKKQGITTDDEEAKTRFFHALEQATTVNDILLIGTGIIIIFLLTLIFGILSKNPKHRAKANEVLYKIPVLGDMLKNSAMSNCTAVISSLLNGGIQTLNTLKITLRSTRDKQCIEYLEKVSDLIKKGVMVRNAFSINPMSMSERIVLQSSNDANQLSIALQNISNLREEIGKQNAKRFATIALLASLAYSGIAVGFSLWVTYIQQSALMGGPQ